MFTRYPLEWRPIIHNGLLDKSLHYCKYETLRTHYISDKYLQNDVGVSVRSERGRGGVGDVASLGYVL